MGGGVTTWLIVIILTFAALAMAAEALRTLLPHLSFRDAAWAIVCANSAYWLLRWAAMLG